MCDAESDPHCMHVVDFGYGNETNVFVCPVECYGIFLLQPAIFAAPIQDV